MCWGWLRSWLRTQDLGSGLWHWDLVLGDANWSWPEWVGLLQLSTGHRQQKMVSRDSQLRSQGTLSDELQTWNIFTLRSYQRILSRSIMWPDLHFWKLAIDAKYRIGWQNQGDQLGNYCIGSGHIWWGPSLRQEWKERWEHLKRYLGDGVDRKWWVIGCDKWGREKSFE